MDTIYILQIITIVITVITLIINVFVTLKTSKQENYNSIITKSRLDFMNQDRISSAQFIAEAKNIALMIKNGNNSMDLKPLYYAFTQISIALKPYNTMEKKILDSGNGIIDLIEQSITNSKLDQTLSTRIDEFVRLINIYDDADWKFIKQQFNSTKKKSEDFDKICEDIISKYN